MPRSVLPLSRRPIKRRPLCPLALEPRLMFDGAAIDTAAQVAVDAAATASPGDSTDIGTPTADAAPSAPPATEIVFITTSTPEWQKLANNVRAGVEVVLLDPERDGLAQINAALAGRTGITALHLVSHGADGLVLLGNTPLDTDTLNERNPEVAGWSTHLEADADILLYGCDVAAGSQGRAFADLLATTTGADVAASSDTTGASAQGGDWTLEYASGSIESSNFLTTEGIEGYDARLATISLSGATGWTAIMFGTMRDPDADSQAGAADTDIIGDTTHGSLYTAYSDSGTASSADDYLYFRMRIDNPTSDTDFSGVAIVGMDANGDGRVDLFMSVDGRNNTRAVRLLDPGTGANLSPNTTSTSPLPTGWLPNNGVYAFSPSNYSVDAVSALNDPHYGLSAVNPATGTATDLTGDGKRDVFISWRVPLADIATVLAKASPMDRSGVYGPRGAEGLAGFNKDTPVRYVSFTQTQPGPINGDLNGVGSSYDKNATFAALGAFTSEMTAGSPVAASTRLDITDNIPGIANGPVTFTFQFSEGVTGFSVDDITVSGGSTGLFTQVDADTYTLVVTPPTDTASGSIQVDVATDAARSLVGNLPTAAGNASQAFDTLAPQITIASPATALSGTPTLQGTTDLPDGSLITVSIDPDNDAGTANNLIYRVVAAGGLWSLDLAATAPVSGTLPAGGLVSYSKVTASATDAAGNTASAVELNPPTVNTQTTSDTTPVVSGTWTNVAGDTLSVTVNGISYTPTITNNAWSVNVTDILSPSATPYEVVATVSRGGSVSDTSTGELTISNAPPTVSVDITGGATASGNDTTPTLTGSSANAGGYVIVRLDPGNDGDLSDAVTYSVTPDGSGNWILDTGSATPISGTVPTGGFIGATGVRAADANAQVNNADAYINMTEDNAVTISGTAAVGFTVHLVIADANGNSFDYTAIPVDGSGNWSLSTSDIGSLDSTTLTLTATLSGTSVSTTNTSYTHDAIAPRIFITNPSEIKKNGGVLYGGSELANTGLTVTIRNDTDTTTVGTWTTTTNASGDWSVTTGGNLVSGASGNIIIRVAPTTAPATDAAKNIVGTAQITQYVAANAVTSAITIGTIAGDNVITVNEIGSGLAITGTTTLAGSGTVTLTVDDGDAGTGANFTATGSYASGTWTVNVTKPQIQGLLNGQLTVTASAQDTSASPAITISDVALPTLSLLTPTLSISDDTPGSAAGPVIFTFQFSEGVTGFTTDDITVGNGSKGSFTAIDADTYTLAVTPTANSSGEITVQVGSNVATGTSTGRGNGDANATQAFNTTVAAAAPNLTINADALASSRTPVITGTSSLPAGAPILVTVDPDNDSGTANTLAYSATVQSDGTWAVDTASATPTSGSLPAGGLTPWARITATATNAFGNSTTVTALDIPAVTPTLSNSATATVSGTWTNLPGDTLSVLINGNTYSLGNGNLNITGNTWSLTTVPLADGSYHVTTTVSRSGPDSRTDLSTLELVIDTVGTVDITGGPTALTGDTTPVISGSTGAWSTAATGSLVPGSYTLDAEVGGQHALRSMTIVAATPPLLTSSSPADNATGVAVGADLTLTFNRNVLPGSGTVSLYRSSDDSLVESYNVSTGLGSLTDGNGSALGRIQFSGNSLTLNPGTDLDAGAFYYIRVDGAAVIDEAGNAFTGIADNTTLDFRTSGGTNLAPVLTTDAGSASFVEGADTASTPVVIDAGLTLADADNTTLSSATVSLTGNFQSAEDVLAFTNDDITMGNITASYNSGTGVLALTSSGATATLAQWQTALRSVVYTNASDTPATSTRTISFSVNDGTDNSTPATRTVTVTAANDSPGITAPTSINVTEDFASALTGLSLTDPDAGSAAVNVTLSVPSGSLAAVSGAGVTVSGTASTLILTGTTSDINSFIAGGNLSFLTASDATGDVILSIDVDDAGNTGIGGTRTDSATLSLVVAAENDPPEVTTTAGTSAYAAGASPVPVDAGVTVGDVDNTTLSSATVSLTVNFQSGQDVLAFTNDSSTMGNITASYNSGTGVLTLTSSGATATLAQWQSALRTVTYDNTSATPATAPRTLAFQVSDGSASSTLGTRSLTVSAPPASGPQISGPSGGQGATVSATSVPENTTPVATFAATEAVNWSLAGSDAARFQIDASGTLRFVSAPDHEAPQDVGDGVANNTYVVEVRATDSDSNVATQTVTVTVTDVQEASAPTQTVSIDRMDKDSGDSDNDFTTADGSGGRGISGSLSAPLGPDELVEISVDGGQTWIRASVTGTAWSVTDPDAHTESWNILARVSNSVANLSGPVSTRPVTLDTEAPIVPTVDPLSTTSITPILSGTAQVGPGERLSITIDGRTYTDGDGHLSLTQGRWTLQLPADAPLTPGTHSVQARVTDLAGNFADDTSRDEITTTDVPPPRPQQPVIDPAVIATPPAPPVTPPPSPNLTPTVTPPATPAVLAVHDPVRNDPIGDQQLSDLRRFADEAQGDFGIRTRSEGFPIVVMRSDSTGGDNSANLLVNRGIPDALIQEQGRQFEVPIPNDAFAHSQQDAIISLTVTRSNGSPLPAWLQFDPRMGIFRGTPPAGFTGDVEIRVIARDQNGNQVEVTFRIRVGGDGRAIRSGALGPANDAPETAARPNFSAQRRMAGASGQSAERDRLVAQARALAARKAASPG